MRHFVLTEWQTKTYWSQGWNGPRDGRYSPQFAAHLRSRLEDLTGQGGPADKILLMTKFLFALDVLTLYPPETDLQTAPDGKATTVEGGTQQATNHPIPVAPDQIHKLPSTPKKQLKKP